MNLQKYQKTVVYAILIGQLPYCYYRVIDFHGFNSTFLPTPSELGRIFSCWVFKDLRNQSEPFCLGLEKYNRVIWWLIEGHLDVLGWGRWIMKKWHYRLLDKLSEAHVSFPSKPHLEVTHTLFKWKPCWKPPLGTAVPICVEVLWTSSMVINLCLGEGVWGLERSFRAK